ncbi:hypothetical protein ABN763_06875 [Spongiivirga sp. MCCC 1A20706]|uniref:hypothetical protein n=1 Tax=Spongiivirga sp. MCCC 1A20706 TaxID=3160963 RepID=UPI0039774B6C
MKGTSLIKKLATTILYILIIVSCSLYITNSLISYNSYKQEQQDFEYAKKKLVEELKFNHWALVDQELQYWRPYFKHVSDSNGHPIRNVSKEQFLSSPYSGFSYTSFEVHEPLNEAWDTFKKSKHIDQLDYQSIASLDKYYKAQETLKLRMKEFTGVSKSVLYNSDSEETLDYHFQRAGSFYNNLFMINITKNSHIYLIQNALKDLGVEMDDTFKKLNEQYYESISQNDSI